MMFADAVMEAEPRRLRNQFYNGTTAKDSLVHTHRYHSELRASPFLTVATKYLLQAGLTGIVCKDSSGRDILAHDVVERRLVSLGLLRPHRALTRDSSDVASPQ